MAAEKIYIVANNFFTRYGRKIVVLCILVYITIFCSISYLKFNSFSYNDVDLSVIERTFWNTIHGNFVAGSVAEQAIFNGGHLFLIIFLLAPFYAVYPHPLTLLFLQSIFLAIPAYFIFNFARRKIDPTFATYFALAYLLYPALAYINLFELHIIAFLPFFALPMFIFFDQRKFWPFVLFMFFCLACKEDVSLVIFGLGIYALFKYARLKPPFIQKQNWKWIAVPLLAGALWLILVTQFIQPYFTVSEANESSDSLNMLTFYSWLGRTPAEIIKNLLLHPIQVLQRIFIPAKNIYLLHLFGPLAFISVLGLKEIVIVLFGLLEALLSQRGTHFSIHYQYPALLIPFIFISAIFGLRCLLQFNFLKRLRLYILVIISCVACFFAFRIGPLFKLPFKQWQRDQRDMLKEAFVKTVAPEALVATSFELATRLTHSKRLFFIYIINLTDQTNYISYLAEQTGQQADHLLLDFVDYLTYFGFYRQDSDRYLKNFLNQYNWNLAYEIDNLALFTKAQESVDPLVATIDKFPEELSGLPGGNQYIKFVGYQLKSQQVLDYPVLHFEGYLECQRKTEQRYVLQIDFYSRGENRLLYRHYFAAADRIYPTKRWKKWEKVKITQNILLPETVAFEDCRLVLNFAQVE